MLKFKNDDVEFKKSWYEYPFSFDDIYNLPKHGGFNKDKLSPDEIILNSLYSTFCFMKL